MPPVPYGERFKTADHLFIDKKSLAVPAASPFSETLNLNCSMGGRNPNEKAVYELKSKEYAGVWFVFDAGYNELISNLKLIVLSDSAEPTGIGDISIL